MEERSVTETRSGSGKLYSITNGGAFCNGDKIGSGKLYSATNGGAFCNGDKIGVR